MESFYGGQQGFSFVVKRNPAEDHDGCFYNVNEINTAAREGVLRYGDYAIVTNTINDYTIEHGDLYRINTQGTAEKVANISHPALSTLISGFSGVHPNPPEGQSVEIDFLSEEDSKTANKLKMTWTYVIDSDSQIIGIEIGVAAPRPVVDIAVQQKQIDISNPLAIASNQGIIQESSNSDNQPFYYDYQIQLPMRSILVSKDIDIDTTNLDTGTLCFITSDIVGKWYESQEFFTNVLQHINLFTAGQTPGASFVMPFDMTKYNQFKILLPKDNIYRWFYQCRIVEYNNDEVTPTSINPWIDSYLDGMQQIEQITTLPIFTDFNEKKRAVFLWIGSDNYPNQLTLESFKNFKIKIKK